MSEKIWDAIVVGGGPAGASAAYDLAAAGARVLVIDKKEFPRDKPCGGGLTPKTLAKLRFDVSEVIERRCTGFDLSYKGKRPISVSGERELCAMTTRQAFDKFCLDKALAKGAAFLCGTVRDVERGGIQ